MKSTAASEIRVRIAPSPTGPFHVGTARTALYNWLFAKAHGGDFLLRIEDTDKNRSERRFEDEIVDSLLWLGLVPDNLSQTGQGSAKNIIRQSERGTMYATYLERLINDGNAYYCYCTPEDLEAQKSVLIAEGLPPKYSGHCRTISAPPSGNYTSVIRFRNPDGIIEFKDLVRGSVKFNGADLGDMVIAKSLTEPLYNFAVVIDDNDMHITHVIRGDDHLSNTPKQILIQRALSFSTPIYAHVPLILGTDRRKLSKRFLESNLLGYRSKGYLPEALINFLALIGWHPAGDNEIFDPSELIKIFDIKRVQKAGAIFEEDKLDWVNVQHLRRLSEKKLYDLLQNFSKTESSRFPWAPALFSKKKLMTSVINADRERMKNFAEFFTRNRFYFEVPDYRSDLLLWKNESPFKTEKILTRLLEIAEDLPAERIDRAALEESIKPLSTSEGNGPVLWPLRVALSGMAQSPDPYDIMVILGRTEAVRRLKRALRVIKDSIH